MSVYSDMYPKAKRRGGRLYLLLLLAPLGVLPVLLGSGKNSFENSSLNQVGLVPAWDSPWVKQFSAPDPVVEGIVQQYVQSLAQEGWDPTKQGVWIQTGLAPVAEYQGSVLLSSASLTKIATTLSSLETWEPNHRFETLVGMTGTLQNGVLNGDLIVKGSGDPLFVWEEAIVLGSALQKIGVQRVTGNLIILGNFAMNFNPEPSEAAQLLRQAWNSKQWSQEAQRQYRALSASVPPPNITIDGDIQVLPSDAANQVTAWLVRHQSLPLIAILKSMNVYSNNAMAEMLANNMGGAPVVMGKVTQAAHLAPGEISLVNGSGLGPENKITPRAIATMLSALEDKLQSLGFSIADVLPVSGEDVGTLVNRSIPLKSAVKTGTLSEVSALAGFIPTRERGPVWFTILNWGWDVEGLRRQQDKLLNEIQSHWGVADAPASFQSKVRLSQSPYQLGDPSRNQPFNGN